MTAHRPVATPRSITVELDDETIRDLSVLGEPVEVLTRLARSAAEGVRGHGRPTRERTDESLQLERDGADLALARKEEAVEGVADDVVRIARQRADEVVETARETAREGAEVPRLEASATEARSERARVALDHERSSADAALEAERATSKTRRTDTLAHERDATDRDLVGERAQTDSMMVDQREANERLLIATMAADEATARAEESASALRMVAEFRELFIGMLGHDLRTPLASIVMGAGQLLQRGALDDRDTATVSRIVRSSQRMTGMITQLLDLTRARLGGGLPIEPRPTDLREVCRDVVEEFEPAIQLEVGGT